MRFDVPGLILVSQIHVAVDWPEVVLVILQFVLEESAHVHVAIPAILAVLYTVHVSDQFDRPIVVSVVRSILQSTFACFPSQIHVAGLPNLYWLPIPMLTQQRLGVPVAN